MAVEERFGEWQHSFRPQRSTVDMIFTLKMVLEKNREWNIEKFAIFIDMEKVFDKVPREEIWRALEHQEYDDPAKLKRAIKSIYRKCENKVKLRDGDTPWFQVRTGVRQGVISPLLFINFMDRCMKEINHVNNTIMLAYADDVAVIWSSEEELQEMTGRWNKVMNDNGMKININKTEVMSITRNERNIEIRIGEAQLKQNFGMLSVLFRDRNVPRKCKVLMYTTVLRPILLCGSETWTMTSKTKSKIVAAEMEVLRKIKRVSRLDRLRNMDIRAESNPGSLSVSKYASIELIDRVWILFRLPPEDFIQQNRETLDTYVLTTTARGKQWLCANSSAGEHTESLKNQERTGKDRTMFLRELKSLLKSLCG
ncbi:uncharacterized protein LOC143021967 [Oratosquilla oratoria]|uniref:uncharacterized protein LOC143021967 n=1 Tax=Oratosquilla oratoria TaxID=337810 RepID=UPI003F768F9F